MSLVIGSIIDNAARVDPHHVAATIGDASITFAELDASSNQTARVLWSKEFAPATGLRGGARRRWPRFPCSARWRGSAPCSHR